MHLDTRQYNDTQTPGDRAICDLLAEQIDMGLPQAENKIWHGHPVWFLEGNPIVGYSKLKNCIRLLFWSGQSFDEAGLQKEGTFQSGRSPIYRGPGGRGPPICRRWLGKAREIQWDYKNIVRRKGQLDRLK